MGQCDDIERSPDINMIRKAIYGNGKPEEGIMYRLHRIEDRQRRMDRFFWLVLGASVSSLFTATAVAVVNGIV